MSLWHTHILLPGAGAARSWPGGSHYPRALLQHGCHFATLCAPLEYRQWPRETAAVVRQAATEPRKEVVAQPSKLKDAMRQ